MLNGEVVRGHSASTVAVGTRITCNNSDSLRYLNLQALVVESVEHKIMSVATSCSCLPRPGTILPHRNTTGARGPLKIPLGQNPSNSRLSFELGKCAIISRVIYIPRRHCRGCKSRAGHGCVYHVSDMWCDSPRIHRGSCPVAAASTKYTAKWPMCCELLWLSAFQSALRRRETRKAHC